MADGSIAIGTTLRQREQQYGCFFTCAEISQLIKGALTRAHGWQRLDADQQEALQMMATKMARILNGDPDVTDHWHDIAGYARLVEERLVREKAEAFDPDEVD